MIKANDLGQDSVISLVIKLAIPTMIAQLINVLYSIIDRMYIGNIPSIGELALAGVGICGPIVTLLTSFGTFVGLGGSILMAMRMGEQKKEKAQQILANAFLLLLLFSGILTLVFLLMKRNLLLWFGASPVTFPYANTYLTIYTMGTFFALMAIGLNYFITCQGYATIAMLAVIIGAVTNILLDTLFIFVLNMGVAGAAWATVLAQMLSCGFASYVLFSRKIPIRITFGNYSTDVMKQILSMGISPFLILATDSVIIIAMNATLQKYGGEQQGDLLISCATIVQSYMLLITGPMIGITGGTQAIISYNYGANKINRVKQTVKYVLTLCFLFTTCMFFISRIFPHYFVQIFTESQSHIALSIWGIKIFTLAIIPLSFQYTFVDALTALGCTKTALSLAMLRKTLYVTATLTLPFILTARYTFFAEPISDILSASISTLVFAKLFTKHLLTKLQNT